MATSGSKSVAVTSFDTLKFSWSVPSNGQSIANNTTTVNWKLELISGSSGRIDSTASKNWSVIVDGETYSGTNTVGIGNNTTKTLASGTTTISHDSSGKKSFAYSFSQQFSITFSGSSIGTKSGSGSGTLDTIARISSVSASNGTLGTAQTLSVTMYDSAFTHTIEYECGEASGVIVTKSGSTSISWTPPIDFASQSPSGTSVYVSLKITTYSGNTVIGSNVKSITCSIPESVKPTVSISVSDPTGFNGKYGAYVKGKSKLKIVVTASGSYDSAIKSYVTTADGKTYTDASITTDIIASSGSLTVIVSVTDSRGRTATASETISVFDYSMPKISSLNVKRCDAQGNSSSSGAYLSVSFSTEITALGNKNTAVYSVKCKKVIETEYTAAPLTSYSGQYSVTGGVFIFPAEKSFSYDIILTAADDFTATERATKGSSIKKLFSIFQRELGLKLGGIAEIEGFDVDMDSVFRKSVNITGKLIQEERLSAALQNGWINYGAGYAQASYWKDKCGIVHLSGLIKSGATTAETVIFTLPEGYRPLTHEKFFAVSLNAICVIDVYDDGNIAIKTGANAGWLSLSGINFRSAT